MGRVSQPVLPLLPAQARSIGPSVGLLEGPDGGVVFVFGLVSFTFACSDRAGRRLAAVQLVTTKIASAREVASGFGVSETTLWRWVGAFADSGVAALVPEQSGPKRPSKLTAQLRAQIVAADAAGSTLSKIAARTGVSTGRPGTSWHPTTAGRPAAGGQPPRRQRRQPRRAGRRAGRGDGR